uniref:Amidinotransferase n=1 Tax=Globodera rostochiensis TaxID=31243 RepID=A0A914GZF2_GLORO
MRGAIGEGLRRVLMVPPKHFSVEYAINPWMEAGVVVDQQKAMDQWTELKTSIEREGVHVLTLDQVKGLPDMVFVCNSGLCYRNKLYLSHFRHSQRIGEQKPFAAFYKRLGLELYGTDYAHVFEGGGDAFFSDQKTLWAGWGGPRTSRKAYEYVQRMGDFETVPCELIDPRFYHLDTCLCPVGIDSALWFPPAFSDDTKKEIRRRLPRAIAVSEAEAMAFVCNAIAIGRRVISPKGIGTETQMALSSLGYTVQEVEMGEFMKSGGACQCLVMKLW